MIVLKTEEDIKGMKRACALAREVLNAVEPRIAAGASTQSLNDFCHEYATRKGAVMAPLNYKGFPKSICTSINHVVCHGIPKESDVLREGDIVNVDVTVVLDGYYGDTSKTYPVGKISSEAALLLQRAEAAMRVGINAVGPEAYLTDIGKQIENYVKKYGYSVVREFGGHGIGKSFHEDPYVPHYWIGKSVLKLKPGMTFTVEPMINLGKPGIAIDKEDGWTVRTKDGKLSAQFEHTVLVTPLGVEILTEDPNSVKKSSPI